MFNLGKELFFVPVVCILKCLTERSDAGIYEALMAGTDPKDHYYRGCVKNMLTEPQEEGLFSSKQVKDDMFSNTLRHFLTFLFVSDERIHRTQFP